MANPQTRPHDGKIWGNILVLGSTGSGKATLVQEMCHNTLENTRKSTGFQKSSSPSKGKTK